MCLQAIEYHKDYVLFVRYTTAGDKFAAACHDGTISLWDSKTYRHIGTFEGHAGAVFCCFFSHDDEHLVSCSGDQTLRLWDVKSQKCVGFCQGHKAPVRFCAYAENGKYLLSASYDSTVKLWDTNALEVACDFVLPGRIHCIAMSQYPCLACVR